jgi:hypothetical protein
MKASPDLYEACRAYIDWLDKKGAYPTLIKIDNLHRKALRKAESGG